MVGEMLSQDEINALLGSIDIDGSDQNDTNDISDMNNKQELDIDQIDALGEIGNISMGTAATTLFTLLNHKVMITTPTVEVLSWQEFQDMLTDDLIAISVDYVEGLLGSNLLLLKDRDVKVISDLMMGGDGTNIDGELTDIHLSAISEAMNQMIGSSSTSMSQMFNKKIDISPPIASKFSEDLQETLEEHGNIVKVSFRIQVEENLIDSELMQILPIDFAKELVSNLLNDTETAEPETNKHEDSNVGIQISKSEPPKEPNTYYDQNHQKLTKDIDNMPKQVSYEQEVHAGYQTSTAYNRETPSQGTLVRDVDVKVPQFQSFESNKMVYPKENMDILMDVSLEVSVELGRTHKRIKEILEYGPGSVIELNRLVGEPIDVLVNGKFVAKGEVVVIDENFGIRITDIINPENRI
jgi:flagellar motor switch protein FliN/FliY